MAVPELRTCLPNEIRPVEARPEARRHLPAAGRERNLYRLKFF